MFERPGSRIGQSVATSKAFVRSRRRRPGSPARSRSRQIRPEVLERLEDRVVLTTLTWTGAVDANWGTVGNWSGGTGTEIPDSPDDILVFGPGATNLSSTNDLPNFQADEIQLTDGGYTFSGNEVDLVTGLTDSAASGINTISLSIAGTGGVSKTGTGQLILDAANTYTGITVASDGILALTNGDSLGATSSGTTVQSSNAVMELRGGVTLAAEPINYMSAGLILGTGGSNELTGPLTLPGANARLQAETGSTLTVSGAIGGSNTQNLFVNDSGVTGTVVFLGANTFANFVSVRAGTLVAASDQALGGSANFTQVLSGATLALQGGITSAEPINLASSGVGGNGALLNLSGQNILSGTISTSSIPRIGSNSGTLTLSGVMSGSTGLTKVGAGTVVLSAANTYTGATNVNGGTLLVNGSLASSGVQVNSGGTLGGTGTTPALTLTSGGTIAPGASPGILNAGGTTFNSGGTFDVELDGTTVGTQYDQLAVGGSISLGDATLQVAVGYAAAVNDSFTIIDNDGADDVIGTFNGLGEGGTFTSGPYEFTISYEGGTGNDVVLTVTRIVYTWDGGDADDSLWSSPDNWVGDMAPVDGASLVFGGGANRLSNFNDFAHNTAFANITVAGAGYSLSGNAIDLGGSIAASYAAGSSTITANIRITDDITIDVASGGTLDMANAISPDNFGAGYVVTKDGGGTLRYSGSSANTYNGGTLIDAGTLVLAKSDSVIASNGNVTVGDNTVAARLELEADHQFWAGSAVTVNEGSTFDVGPNAEYISILNLQGATVEVDAGGMLRLHSQLTSAATANNLTSTISGDGVLDLNGNASIAIDIADDASVLIDTRISTVVENGGFFKAGAGILALSGSNTYAGETAVNAGAIQAEHSDALGTTAGGTTVSSGASVFFSGSGLSIAEDFSIIGVGYTASGALGTLSGATTLTGSITMAGDSQVGASLSSALIINGVIDDGGDRYSLSILSHSSGLVELVGSNTFDGDVTIDGGTLKAANDNALGDPTASTIVAVNSGASFDLSGGITLPGTKAIILEGLTAGGASKVNNVAGDNTILGDISIIGGNNVSFGVGSGNTLTLAGAISGSRDFDKNGGGTLVLSGTSTHTGNVNVGDGTLLVDGSIATSNSVFVDGRLGGSGAVPSVTASGIGTIAPGNSPGILSSGNVDFTDGSTYSVELDGSTVGTQYDQLEVTGSVTIGASTLQVSIGTTPSIGDSFTIISNDGTDTVTGTFSGLPEGSTITSGAATLTISYAGGSGGNDVVLTVTDVTFVWSGASDIGREWSIGANWVGGVAPTAGANLVFPNSPVRTESLNDFASGTAFNSITIAGSGYDIYGNPIELENGIEATFTSGSSSFDIATTLAEAQTIEVAAGGTFNVTGSLLGSVLLTKAGDGTLRLVNSGNEAGLTGGIAVDGGTLSADLDDALPSGTISLAGGTTLSIDGSTEIDNAIALGGLGVSIFVSSGHSVGISGIILEIGGVRELTKLGGGTLVLSASNTYTGASFVNAGTLSLSGGLAITDGSAVTVGAGGTLRLLASETIGSLAGSGSVDLGVFTLTTGGNGTSTSFDGVLSGSGDLTKAGGGTFSLGGTNTFGGGTTVQAGTLSVSSSSNLGSGRVALDGGTLSIDGASTITNDVAIGGSGGTISNANDVTISGGLSGAGTLIKGGAGNLSLTSTTNSNNFSGGITGQSGRLSVASDQNLGTGTLTLAGSWFSITGDTTIDNDIVLAASTTVIEVANGITANLSGALTESGGSRSLNKGSSGTLVFSGTTSHTGNTVINGGSIVVPAGGNFGSASTIFFNNGTGPLVITGSGTLANPIIVRGSGAVIENAGDVTLSGLISVEANGTAAKTLTKSGAGTLTLSNPGNEAATNNSGFTLGLTVADGSVSAAHDDMLPFGTLSLNGGALNITGATTIDNAVVLGGDAAINTSASVTLSGLLSGSATLTKLGTDTLTLSNTGNEAAFTGGMSIVEGTVAVTSDDALPAGIISLDSGATLQVGGGPITIDNAIQLGQDGGVIDTLGDSGVVVTFSGLFSGTGTLSKTGGAALHLTNVGNEAAWSGGVSVDAGVLRITVDEALSSGSLSLASGTGLAIFGATTIDNAIGMSGPATISNFSPVTISGLLSGSSALTLFGTQTLTLTNPGNSASYTGGIFSLMTAALEVPSDGALVGGPVTLAQGGATLSVTGNTTIDNDLVLAWHGNGISVAEGITVLYSGEMSESSGPRDFFKTGGGTLVLTESSSYTGETIVEAGTLRVTGSIASSSSIWIDGGATLGGSGTVPAIRASAGSVVSPGNSPGILSSGSVSFEAGSDLMIELGGIGVGTEYDQLLVTGEVSIDPDVTLSPSFIDGFQAVGGEQFTILGNDGSDAIEGTFAGLPEGTIFSINDTLFRISYVGGTGNDVVLTALLSPTIDVSSSMNPAEFGSSIVFSASLSGMEGIPTGEVTLRIGDTDIQTVMLVDGQAVFSAIDDLAVGSYIVSISYHGDTFYNTGTGTLTGGQEIVRASTTTSVDASPNPSIFTQTVTFTATVSAAFGTPTGQVEFFDGGTSLGTATLDGSGVASLEVSALSVGAHRITATYLGDPSYLQSTDASPVDQVVTKISTTTSLAAMPNPSVFGQSVTFTAIVSATFGQETPTGSVAFLDGSTVLGTAELDGSGVATFSSSALAVGGRTITARFLGEAAFEISTSAIVVQGVNHADVSLEITTAPDTATVGRPITFGFKASAVSPGAGTPGGLVEVLVDGVFRQFVTLNDEGLGVAELTFTDAGPFAVSFRYLGDANFSASEAAVGTTVEVEAASTVAVLSSSAERSVVGQPVTFTVTVTPIAPGAGTPTGQVTFLNGSEVIGTAMLVDGVASLTVSGLPFGTNDIRAVYAGSSAFDGASSETVPVAVGVTLGDYDGDGVADLALYEYLPGVGSGRFDILLSSGGTLSSMIGGEGDLPVVGDFDGDGRSDMAVFSPNFGGDAALWIIQRSSDGVREVISFGAPDLMDLPAPADYDGDGVTDIATFRANSDLTPGAAEWFIRPSSDPMAGYSVVFGAAGGMDVPVPADYDGDGLADIATFRSNSDLSEVSAQWFILNSGGSGSATMADLGAPGSIDAPGDYDGDGRDELAAFDRVLGDWRIRPLGSSSTMETSFGPRGPRVIPVLSSINDRLETDEESDELDAPAVDEALGSLGRVLAGRN